MNPKSRTFNVKKCAICGFPFSDEHHLYPQRRDGAKTMMLCPNHHRAANIIQIIVEQCVAKGERGFEVAEEFSRKFFDDDFNVVVGPLIDAYIYEEARTTDKMFGA